MGAGDGDPPVVSRDTIEITTFMITTAMFTAVTGIIWSIGETRPEGLSRVERLGDGSSKQLPGTARTVA